MKFSGETLTTVTHQSQLEAITNIMQSLNNPKETPKKLRHSLKNLCFYKASANVLGPLAAIMKREIIEPSHCFKLVCYHLIANSHLSDLCPQIPSLIKELANYLSGDKIGSHAYLAYRVFFYLCSNLPEYYSTLIDTTAKILSIPGDELKKVSKKGFFSKEKTSPYEPLIHEIVALLVDLPDFENSANKLLTPELIGKLVELEKFFPKDSKTRFIHFLGRLKETPEQLKNVKDTNDLPLLELPFIAKNKETYDEFIKTTLETGRGEMYAFKYELCLTGFKEKVLLDSVLFGVKPTVNCLLPILELKTRFPDIDISNILPSIFVAASDDNPTTAFLAFNILLFTDLEEEWIKSSIRVIFSIYEPEMRASSMKRLYTTWNAIVTDEKSFNKVVSPILAIILYEFSDAIESASLQEFVKLLIKKNICDPFIEMECSILNKLPENNSVIYMIYAASLMSATTKPELFAVFKEKVETFLVDADPSLGQIYRTLIK